MRTNLSSSSSNACTLLNGNTNFGDDNFGRISLSSGSLSMDPFSQTMSVPANSNLSSNFHNLPPITMMADNVHHHSVKLRNSSINSCSHHPSNHQFLNQSIRSSLSSSSSSTSLSSPSSSILNNDHANNNYHHQSNQFSQASIAAAAAHLSLFQQYQQKQRQQVTSPSFNGKSDPFVSRAKMANVDSKFIDNSHYSKTNVNANFPQAQAHMNTDAHQWMNDLNPFPISSQSQSTLNEFIGNDFLPPSSLLSDEYDNNDLSPLLDNFNPNLLSINNGDTLNEFHLNVANDNLTHSKNGSRLNSMPYESASIGSVSSVDISSPYSVPQPTSISSMASSSTSCSRTSPSFISTSSHKTTNSHSQKTHLPPTLMNNDKFSPVTSPLTSIGTISGLCPSSSTSSCPSTPYSFVKTNTTTPQTHSQYESSMKSFNNNVDSSAHSSLDTSSSINHIKHEETPSNSPYSVQQTSNLNHATNISQKSLSIKHSPSTVDLQSSTEACIDPFMSMSSNNSNTIVDEFNLNDDNCENPMHNNDFFDNNNMTKYNTTSSARMERQFSGLSSYLNEMAQMTSRQVSPIIQQQQRSTSSMETSCQESNINSHDRNTSPSCDFSGSYNPLSSLAASKLPYDFHANNNKSQGSYNNQYSPLLDPNLVFDPKLGEMRQRKKRGRPKKHSTSSNSSPQSTLNNWFNQSSTDPTMSQSLSSSMSSMYDCSLSPVTTLASNQRRLHHDGDNRFDNESPPPLSMQPKLQPLTPGSDELNSSVPFSSNTKSFDPYAFPGNSSSLLDQCHHIPDNHYNHQASHYHHQQSYSNTTTGIGKKRSRGRPRLNEANNNSSNKSTSRHSISKSLIQSLLAKLPSSASLISRIPCVEQSLISTSPSSATTVMKRGRGRPKSLKTLLKEAEMAGLEIPPDVIDALMTNQQQRQRARHSQLQKRESLHYYSDQLDHHSIQDDHHLLLHSRNPQHLPPSFQQQSYSNSNQTEHGFIAQQDQIQYNISSQRSEPRFSYHQYQSKQHKALPWMNQQQQPQTTFHSLSDNMNSDNFIHHQQSISDGKFLHSEINSQQPRDLPNVATRKHILYNINNNNHNNHNDNKVIEQYETEIVKNPFDDLDDSMSLQSSSMNNLSIKSNNDVKTVAPIRISLTNNSLFHCPSSTATRSILAQQEQELQSQSAKRKRSNFSANLFSDNDDEDDDTYDDDSNESIYSTPSSFEDDDDDDDTHDDDRNKRRKHQDNDIDQYFSVSKSPFNTSIQTDISRKSNYSHKRQQYTLTGKPKFTESIMMDCLNASLIGDKDNDDDDVNDELLDNFKFNHADYDEEASKKCHEMQEDTPKLPKLLLKRLDSDDNGFKIIQNSGENEKEIEINNNPESKSETVKKLTIRFSTNGEARVDQNGNNSNEMTSCLEKSICNELVEHICSSTTENTEITLPNIKSINQISDDKDNICYQQATNSPENAITNALIDDSQQDAFENNEMNSATVKEVTSILSTNPVDENPLFRTPSPPPAFDRSIINLANHPSSLMESILPINCLDTTKLISDNEQFSAINSIMNLDDFEPNESPSQEIEVNPLISNRSNLVHNLKNIENVGNSDNVDYVFDQNDGNIGIQEQPKTEQSTDKQTEKFFESSKSTEIDTTTESFIQGQGGHNNKTKSIESSIVDNIVKNVADSNEQNLLNVDNKDLLNNDIDMKTFSPDLEEPKPLSPYSSPKHIQSTVNSALITNTTTNITATVTMPSPIQSISHHIDEPQINSSNIQLPPQLLQSNLSSVNQVMASQTSSKSPLQQPVPNSIYIQQQSIPSKGFPLQQQQPQPQLPVFHFPPNSAIRLLAPSVSPQIQHSSTVHPQHNVRPAFLFQSAEQNLGFHAPTQQPQFMIRGPFAPPRHQPSFQPPQMIKTQTPNGSTINLILSHPNTPSPYSYTVRPPPSQAGTALLNPVFSNSINQPMFIRNGPRLIPVNPGLMNTMRMFAPGQPHRPNPQAFFTMAAPISSSQHLIQQTIRQHQQQVAFQQHRLTSTPIFFSSPITNQKVILEAKPSTMIKDELNPSTRQLPIKDILTEAMEEIRFDDIDDQPDNSNQQPQAHSKIMKVSDTVRLSSPVINPNNSHPTFINQMSSAMTSQSLIRSTSQHVQRQSIMQPTILDFVSKDPNNQSQPEVQLTNDDLDRLFDDLDSNTNVDHFDHDDFGFLEEISQSNEPINKKLQQPQSNSIENDIQESSLALECECLQIINVIIDSIESQINQNKPMVDDTNIHCIVDEILEKISVSDQEQFKSIDCFTKNLSSLALHKTTELHDNAVGHTYDINGEKLEISKIVSLVDYDSDDSAIVIGSSSNNERSEKLVENIKTIKISDSVIVCNSTALSLPSKLDCSNHDKSTEKMLKEAEYDENNWLTKQTISRRWSLESASSDEEKTTLFGLKPKHEYLRSYSSDSLLQSLYQDQNKVKEFDTSKADCKNDLIVGSLTATVIDNVCNEKTFRSQCISPDSYLQCPSSSSSPSQSLSKIKLASNSELIKDKNDFQKKINLNKSPPAITNVQHPDITSSVIDDEEHHYNCDNRDCGQKYDDKNSCCLHCHHHHHFVLHHHHCSHCHGKNSKLTKISDVENDDEDVCHRCLHPKIDDNKIDLKSSETSTLVQTTSFKEPSITTKRKCTHVIPATTVSINVNAEIVLNSNVKNATTIIHINHMNNSIDTFDHTKRLKVDDEKNNNYNHDNTDSQKS